MRRLLALLPVLFLTVMISATSAGAGGWAVTILDALPDLRSGQEVDIGFTIRQHGVTPVALEGVSLELRGPTGELEVVPAAAGGLPGQYVATVRPSEPGSWALTVNQGWFGPQELGVFEVAESAPAEGTLSALTYQGRWPAGARYGLPALAAVLVLAAVADLRASRRRRSLSAAP